MLKAQGGGCAMCGKPPKNRRLHIDHDHKTKIIRGLLCYYCNRQLVGRHTLETATKLVIYLSLLGRRGEQVPSSYDDRAAREGAASQS